MPLRNGYSASIEGDGGSAAAILSTYEKIAWQITVDGTAVKRILSLEISQSFSAHHAFELRLYHTELEDPRTYRIERTRELLGKPLSVVLGTHTTADITRFTGIITEVAFEEKTGLYGEVVLRGASPTILLECGAHYRSFLDKNLSSIADEVLAPVRGRLETGVQPRFTGNIGYTVQHGESHFQFLNRLAALHGEWFYYDGEQMQFGRPSRGGEHELQYARHIESLQMAMRAAPVSFETIGYRAAEDQALSQKAPDSVPGLNFYGDTAVEKSKSIYPETVRHYSALHAPDQGELTRSTGVAKAALAADTFSVKGTSRHPAPRPGLRLRVMMSGSEMGEYLVTKATHRLDNVNNYSCAFEALGSDLEVQPVSGRIVLPRAEAQVATVTSNNDPAGQGRVQVQMQWQDEDNTTPWIRVMTPDAGSSGVVSKNRGYVFIPEEGDQVMVGFENGNPDAPFVLGSLFHGVNGAGGGADNVTKSISTRSGHRIELNDNGDGTHIIIRDPGGNEIFLDTRGRNITVTAPETITLQAKNINLHAEESIAAMAGLNITESAGLHITQNAGDSLSQFAVNDYRATATNIISIATENMDVQARSIEETSDDLRMDSAKEPMVFNSAKSVDVKSAEKSKLF